MANRLERKVLNVPMVKLTVQRNWVVVLAGLLKEVTVTPILLQAITRQGKRLEPFPNYPLIK